MTQRRGRGRPSSTDIDTTQALLSAALTRFAAKGYEATSLRDISGDANVDVALIPYRFGGKVGLWKAIVSQAAKELHDNLHRALAQTDNKGECEKLRHSMKAFLDYLLARPEVPRLLLRDINNDGDRSQWLLEELSLPLHRHFNDLAQAAAASRPRPVEHLQFRVANFIYSAASTVARRERLALLVEDTATDEPQFAAALEAMLIDEVLACG
ncbi:MAG: TetR family transcriptional regulator [Alteraurantiacibacter sp.]